MTLVDGFKFLSHLIGFLYQVFHLPFSLSDGGGDLNELPTVWDVCELIWSGSAVGV